MTAHPRFAITTFFVILSLAFFSCKQKTINVQRGFYYWKSNESVLDTKEINTVKELGVEKLYVKYFEIEFDKIFGATPTSKASLNFRYPDNAEVLPGAQIIPVVFVQNDVLINTSSEELDSLASNILFLANKRYQDQMLYHKGFEELQIDCDWTASTRDKYFVLLKALKKRSGKIISCTLRMYPYKYPDLMGVPPVDKATLMCYNLNNPLENESKNSILDVEEIKKYLTSKTPYPLHLDIALPLHSWMLSFQNRQFAGILHNQYAVNEIAEPEKPLWYRVTKDTVIGDIFLRVGDRIKYEHVTKEQLMKLAGVLKARLKVTDSTTVSFFHLDKDALNKYSHEMLDQLYNSF